MKKINTLLLYADGYGKRGTILNTFVRGILKIPYNKEVPQFLKKVPFLYTLYSYILNQYDFLAYTNDWKEAIINSKYLKVKSCNICNIFELRKVKHIINEYDLIIVLHSAAGDNMNIINSLKSHLVNRKGKLAMFIGNEYDLMDEKLQFIKDTCVDLVCSQLPIDTAVWLYSSGPVTKVIEMPHALNSSVYRDYGKARNINIGFIGAKYPLFIGDIERNNFLEYCKSHLYSKDLTFHIEIGKRKKLPRKDWIKFLNNCKGIIGAEAGSYYIDINCSIIQKAKEYLSKNPLISFEELYHLFFKQINEEVRYGKAISSRHFEPIGTKTCQILLEGYYNGILKPNIHYIEVKKDFSNFDDAIRMFKDKTFRNRIINQAYEYVLENHTYSKRIDFLIKHL